VIKQTHNHSWGPEIKDLIDDIVKHIRMRRYSIRTEKTYVDWCIRFIRYHEGKLPQALGGEGIRVFLEDLVIRGNVAASTQNQALNALIFMYREVLDIDVGTIGEFVRARRPRRLPVVLSQMEVSCLLANMEGIHKVMASLLYGAGLRLMECIRLRVQDLDFHRSAIMVRSGKGTKDRVVPLPQSIVDDLKEHLKQVARIHQKDLDDDYGEVFLPDALGTIKEAYCQGMVVAICFSQ
jgi:site-specific recombinase XerD